MTAAPVHRPRRRRCHHARRGLTLLELMLALIVTSVIALGSTAMMSAVSSGVVDNRDQRTVMVRANAAQSRLSAYVGPSLCVLAAQNGEITLWYDDSRESGTVHATEIRWLVFSPVDSILYVYKVEFPDAWTDTSKDLADLEYPAGTDWNAVYADYDVRGYMSAAPIIDGLDGMGVTTNEALAPDSQQVIVDLTFTATDRLVDVRVSCALQYHVQPGGP